MNFAILIVEDNKEISGIIGEFFINSGFDCEVASDGFMALELFGSKEYHLILLDIMMPGISGFEVLKVIKETSDVPVIIISARKEEIDRLKGFNLGAEDYVIKPFSIKELLARADAILNRVYGKTKDIVLNYKELSLNINRQKLYKNQKEIILTSLEFNLLRLFFENRGKVFSRTQLISHLFGYDYEGNERNIDTYIKRIRKKIETADEEERYLKTRYGSGYYIEVDDSAD